MADSLSQAAMKPPAFRLNRALVGVGVRPRSFPTPFQDILARFVLIPLVLVEVVISLWKDVGRWCNLKEYVRGSRMAPLRVRESLPADRSDSLSRHAHFAQEKMVGAEDGQKMFSYPRSRRSKTGAKASRPANVFGCSQTSTRVSPAWA